MSVLLSYNFVGSALAGWTMQQMGGYAADGAALAGVMRTSTLQNCFSYKAFGFSTGTNVYQLQIKIGVKRPGALGDIAFADRQRWTWWMKTNDAAHPCMLRLSYYKNPTIGYFFVNGMTIGSSGFEDYAAAVSSLQNPDNDTAIERTLTYVLNTQTLLGYVLIDGVPFAEVRAASIEAMPVSTDIYIEDRSFKTPFPDGESHIRSRSLVYENPDDQVISLTESFTGADAAASFASKTEQNPRASLTNRERFQNSQLQSRKF